MRTLQVDPSTRSAYRDILAALQKSAAGDLILVAPGRYQGSLIVPHSVELRAQAEKFVLAGSIRVEGNGVHLTLSGCSVLDSEESGIIVAGGCALAISDCVFSNHAKYGISVLGNGRVVAQQCTFSANRGCGLFLFEQANVSLEKCNCSGNGESGLALAGSSMAALEQCELALNGLNGLWLNPGTSAKISLSNVHGNKRSGLGVQGGNLEAHSCKILNNEGEGLFFSKATGSVEECQIRNNRLHGLRMDSSANPVILRCKFSDNGETGIFAYSNARGSIEGCDFSGEAGGNLPRITINGSTTTIRNCRVEGGKGVGILLRDHAKSSIEDVECYKNAGTGIQVESQSEVSIMRAKAGGNGGSGIMISGESTALLEECEIWGNALFGLDIQTSSNALIQNCRTYDNEQTGIFVSSNADVKLKGCDVSGGGDEYPGITINGARAFIEKCQVHDTNNSGIYFRDAAKGLVQETTCSNNLLFGLWVARSEVFVTGGRFHDNRQSGTYISNEAEVSIEECEYWSGSLNYSGISISGSKAVINNTTIHDIESVGIYACEKASGLIENCSFSKNTGNGVLIYSEAEFQIKNCRVFENGKKGIHFSHKGKGLVQDCQIHGNAESGVHIEEGAHATTVRSEIHENGWNAIFIRAGGTGMVKGCEIWGGGPDCPGIKIDGAKATINECRLHETKSSGIYFSNSATGSVEKTECWLNQVSGIWIGNGSEVSVKFCRSHENGQCGIGVFDKANVKVEECEIWGGGDDYPGIGIFSASASIVRSRVHGTASHGIYFNNDSNGSVESCKVWRNEIGGIVIANRSIVQIFGCQSRFNDLAGIWLFGASRTRIADCVITNNAGSGAIVERNAVADFSTCTITENDGNGIIFREQAVGSVKDSKVEKNVADPYFNDGSAEVRFDGIQADLVPQSRIPQVGVGAALSTAEAELNRLVGLAVVKSTIRKVRARVDVARGDIRKIDSLHSLFLGGPGTGKTTVALLMGRLLHELGVTKSPKVVICERKDLVAQFLGQTAQRTQKKIDEAIGGVLFIDEAYTLVNRESGQDYGQEAIDTLLPEMERRKHELVVICAGYPDRMEDFVRSNPGLKERFRYRFYFEDFKPDELMRIFDDMLLEREVPITPEAREAVKQELRIRYDSRGEGFANARMIRNFIADAHDNLALRVLEEKRVEVLLEKADVAPLCVSIPPEPQPVRVMLSELNKLVGLEQLKAQVALLVERINFERMIAERESAQFEMPNLHALFLGSPGTGKTTVAKLMGEIYRGMGLLSRGHVIIISDRSQIIGQYIGQTAPLVLKKVREAFGGVLFIDEAYNLVIGENDLFGREALGVLNTEMENNRGKFVLIAAGYEHEMQTFLQVNTGFQSRFPDANHFYFDDYSPQELLQIFERMVSSKRYTLAPDALESVLQEFTTGWGERGSGFSNGRAVRNYFEEVMSKIAQRGNRFPKDTPLEILKTIVHEDVEGLQISRGKVGANLIRPQIGFR